MIDEGAFAQAEQLVKEATRVLVQGIRHFPKDCLSCRAQIAIQLFAGMFYHQAVAYGSDADLKIPLGLIYMGREKKIPDDVREVWARSESNDDFEPWIKEGEAT